MGRRGSLGYPITSRPPCVDLELWYEPVKSSVALLMRQLRYHSLLFETKARWVRWLNLWSSPRLVCEQNDLIYSSSRADYQSIPYTKDSSHSEGFELPPRIPKMRVNGIQLE
jgi:hypothetical protein